MLREAKKLLLHNADEADVFDARRFFGDSQGDWLLGAVNKKTHQASLVQIGGVDKYLIIWHKDAQNRLFVNCAIERNGGGEFEKLIIALKQLARENGCNGISCNATRDGLVKKLLDFKFTVKGLTLEYDF